jgi:excisionase family DNA binding protein
MQQAEYPTYIEAAALLKVARSTVIRWTREGRLPLYKWGRIASVKKHDVLAVLQEVTSTWGGSRASAGRPGKLEKQTTGTEDA